ncbi:MAG: isochorismatase family protein [Burkholderiales bacterium]|jgi:nicotinamidase/pyrazinamidase|nr:isochorismatase family protein [Burkholderiales bacterium]
MDPAFPKNLPQDSALLIVDLQNDFLPGGALAVADGNHAAFACRRYLDMFAAQAKPIYLSRDWHPPLHYSFVKQGGAWPAHCVVDTQGACFASVLNIPQNAVIISKGTSENKDAYSAFNGTDLDARLKTTKIHHLFVCGLATDYCVRATALDARHLGYEVTVLRDAIAAVNVNVDDGERALQEMRQAGCIIDGFDFERI